MSQFVSALREEIRRLARKEIKLQVGATKQAVGHYRKEIAQLKRQLQEQGKQLGLLRARSQKASDQPAPQADDAQGMRFSARSVKAQRKRLGLSAADYGALVGVSPLSIYNWELGKARPRKAQFAALVAIRGIGKREALKRLQGPAK